MSEKELLESLKAEGWVNVQAVEFPLLQDFGEHVHDVRTVHVIIAGELIIRDELGKQSYKPGDRVEFAAGTVHTAMSGKEGVRFAVGTAKAASEAV